MADELIRIGSLGNSIRMKDMGDGTVAEVVDAYLDPGSTTDAAQAGVELRHIRWVMDEGNLRMEMRAIRIGIQLLLERFGVDVDLLDEAVVTLEDE